MKWLVFFLLASVILPAHADGKVSAHVEHLVTGGAAPPPGMRPHQATPSGGVRVTFTSNSQKPVEATSDHDGNFLVSLPAGTYAVHTAVNPGQMLSVLISRPAHSGPEPVPARGRGDSVTVVDGQTIQVTVRLTTMAP